MTAADDDSASTLERARGASRHVMAALSRTGASRADWSVRLVDAGGRGYAVARGVERPVALRRTTGVMVTVYDGDGAGYASTADLGAGSLEAATRRALDWARLGARHGVSGAARVPVTSAVFEAHGELPDIEPTLAQLHAADAALLAPDGRPVDAVVDRAASLDVERRTSVLLSSAGAEVVQRFGFVEPMMSVTVERAGETQTRSLGGGERAALGGVDHYGAPGPFADAAQLAREALALLDAPDCPAETMDVVLMPSQLYLQVHESIGHPLELDRILGDERNYAGGSFVTPDMFGSFQYGSTPLNVVFDPTRGGALGSYACDDEGTPAEFAYLIRDGVLLRGLGGALSQARSNLPGVACARASSWNRPPIDRMANLDIVPGNASLDAMIASVERGIVMHTNRSWSIDDLRNKFQFGCEYARRVRDGELAEVVRNPNYRGVSQSFWRSLDMVGDADSARGYGTPYCGKGEPNQVARVGHATPACLFRGVEVFGRG